MKILAIGDIVGKPGRRILAEKLPDFIEKENIDFCVVNAENAAGGSGITIKILNQLLEMPIDVLTSGDHVWKKKEIIETIKTETRLLRPANLSPEAAGEGAHIYTAKNGVKVGVLNLQGRTFMRPCDCPFRAARRIVAELREETPVIAVDFHAEATSEKIGMGWFLDGQASFVFGTHTHVQTADERVLPGGAAYITDLGMTGAHKSIIGRKIDAVLKATITQMPVPFDVAKEDPRISGAIADIDEKTGKARDIRRVQICLEN